MSRGDASTGCSWAPIGARRVSFPVPLAQSLDPESAEASESAKPTESTDVGFSHIALTVRNSATSIDFYARYAGMEVVHERGESGKRVVWLSDLSRPFAIVLIEVEEVEGRLSGIAHLGTSCASAAEVDRLCELAEREGHLILGPSDDGPPVGYWALLRDPDGHNLELSYGQQVALAVGTARTRQLA